MTEITNFGQSLWVSFYQTINGFMRFLPALIGAIIVLVIGWYVGKLVAALVHRVLQGIGLERASAKAGISNFISQTGSTMTASRLVAELARWFVFLIFIQAAASVLGIPQLTMIINQIVLFLPQLAVGVLILVAGALLANFVSAIVRGSVSKLNIGNAEFFATFTRAVIIAFSVIAALSHVGIAPVIVNTLFIGLVAGVALAIGLAFGLGGRESASQLVGRWVDRSGALRQMKGSEFGGPKKPGERAA